MKWNHLQVSRNRFLIYIPKVELFNIGLGMASNKIDFLVNETPQSIDLATVFMYSPGACFQPQFEVVNRFTRTRMKWENSNFFVEKYRNFYNCPIEFKSLEVKTKFHREFYTIFANDLRFQPVFTAKNHFELGLDFYFYHTDTLSGVAAKNISFYVIDISIRSIYIPPGELYGDYEKMLLPFDVGSWIGISLTVLFVVAAITAFKVFSPSNQELFLGRNNRSPWMNFVSILLNGNQHTNLIGNVPRMFLMIFLLWSIVIRSVFPI
jgi:hypothetical protein